MVGLGLSFKNSGLDLDCQISHCACLWHGNKGPVRNITPSRPVTGHRQHLILSQHFLKLLSTGPVICFLDVDETNLDIFGILPEFLDNLLESKDMVFCATT